MITKNLHVTIYNATSIDGFIATKNDNTDWVSDTDWEIFQNLTKQHDVVIMGRRTYETVLDDFPFNCKLNIVLTNQKQLLKKENNIWFTNKKPAKILHEIEKNGFKTCLIIGGGKTNASFLEANLVDEVIVDIHPIILGGGIKLFETNKQLQYQLKLIESKQIKNGLCLNKYLVKY